jgi:IS30 family transposase
MFEAREGFWRLRSAGLPVQVAADKVGCTFSVAHGWVRERGGIPPRSRPAPAGRYLTLEQRETIALMLAAGQPQKDIATAIGKDPGTVSREIARNSPPPSRGKAQPYRALYAHRKAMARAPRPKAAKLTTHAELRDYVEARLEEKWSPKQISHTLRVDFPDRQDMRVSTETIYQSLFVQGRGALRRELHKCLRTGRAVRRPNKASTGRRAHVPQQLLISERPAEVEDRAVPGHWEGDLILGADNKSAIGTLVERTTRFVLLLHLPHDHRAETVRDALIEAIKTLPAELRRSLTWDQGVEMAKHADITLTTDLAIYFCDPHSPWQRGSNENTNGLLRQYFPKGTDLAVHSAEHLAFVAHQLNTRPRETLNWQTPLTAISRLIATAA